jgi:hypothetical protein
MTEPLVRPCIAVGRCAGPWVCLQLLYSIRCPHTHGSVFCRNPPPTGEVQ